MGEWQPIETAPKDETWVILYGAHYDEPRGCIAFWSEDDSFPEGGAWYESEASSRPVNGEHWQPTHWMPLPAPPAK